MTAPARVYSQTQVDGVKWVCPDCGSCIEWWMGREVHDRWHELLTAALGVTA